MPDRAMMLFFQRSFPGAVLLLVVGLARSISAAVESDVAAPARPWPTAAPEEVGIDAAPLADMLNFIRARQIPVHSIQLIRRGRLVLDAYFYPYDGRTRHDVASVTKSITSTLVGLAIARGHIRDVQQPVLSFFPGRIIAGLDARKRQQTLENLLTMRSGWDCGVPFGTPTINADRQLAEMRHRGDWAQFALDLPMTAEPGTRFLYCNANCHLLSALLTRVTGTNALGFARHELFQPLGIRDVAWPADPQGNNYGWGDLQLHPHEMARLGQLFLQRGEWGGRQLIPEDWVRTATRPHVTSTGSKDQYGYFWWVSAQIPGLFEAVGRGGQRITVWPAKELVLVYTGGGFDPGDLGSFILNSLKAVTPEKSDQPLPANPAANARLRDGILAATRPPAAQPVAKLPALAARISGKAYTLTANELDLSMLTIEFGNQAMVRFTRLGRELRCPVGLDGIGRFSSDTLEELPFACQGRWLNADTFLLELDRVAGISVYRFKLAFADEGRSVTLFLSERTGLAEEVIKGTESGGTKF